MGGKYLTLLLSTSVLSGLCLIPMADSYATGGHFMVESGDITAPGECELELWGQRINSSPDATQVLEIQPACSTRNGWEITVPVKYLTSDNQLAEYGLKFKTVLSADVYGGAWTALGAWRPL